jgi:YD repeat-containing protein
VTQGSQTRVFTYDSVNRLSNVFGTDTNNTLLWGENFQYDRYGNAWTPDIAGLAISGITPRTNVFTNGNQFSMGIYDQAGNQMVVGSYHLTYDAENRQTKVEDQGTLSNGSTFYQYDANGQRVAKARDTGLTIYVYDAFGKLTSEYTNFPVGTPPCATCYLSQDHLGNTRLVTDQAGNTVARHDYRPFGDELVSGDGGRGAD